MILRGGITLVWNSVCNLAPHALTGLYLLSPVDLLPEALLGPLGLLDDLLVILFYARHLCQRFRH